MSVTYQPQSLSLSTIRCPRYTFYYLLSANSIASFVFISIFFILFVVLAPLTTLQSLQEGSMRVRKLMVLRLLQFRKVNMLEKVFIAFFSLIFGPNISVLLQDSKMGVPYYT